MEMRLWFVGIASLLICRTVPSMPSQIVSVIWSQFEAKDVLQYHQGSRWGCAARLDLASHWLGFPLVAEDHPTLCAAPTGCDTLAQFDWMQAGPPIVPGVEVDGSVGTCRDSPIRTASSNECNIYIIFTAIVITATIRHWAGMVCYRRHIPSHDHRGRRASYCLRAVLVNGPYGPDRWVQRWPQRIVKKGS